MGIAEIIKEIRKLPSNQQMLIIEKTLAEIRKEETRSELEKGVQAVKNDYTFDENLTAFTALDPENFYEAR